MSKKEIILIFILLIIALVRFFYFIPEKPNYDKAIGEKVKLEGVVVDTPDIRIFNQRIVVRPDKEESNILVVIPKEQDVFYGDKVLVSGFLETPENFITQSGKEFNYERYLANKDIYFIIKNAEIQIISHDNLSYIKGKLFKLRNSFMENIKRVITPFKSDLANGLILGARGGFDNETKEEFISTGTIHIVALSGYNITIVAEGVMKFFGLFLSQVLSIILGVVVILLFILMTGASATAIRAGIMAFIMLFGRMTGRNYDAGRALVIAGLLMMTHDLRVITDISFQLSFLATGGVLFITPKVVGWVRFLPMRFKFRELVATTIAATISVLPILLYSTGIFSLVSLPSNILILPFIPLAMLSSFLVGIVGFISPTLSLPFAYVSDLLLSYILGVIHFFARLPFASVNIKSFPLIITILLYCVLLFWVFRKKIHQSTL
ncbi:MAG: ComEC/Rec2 family competence protein [Candidatus Paceibacterota bacterium]